MPDHSSLLNDQSHRPWVIPAGRWKYYQEWNNALFFHWGVPFEQLRQLVPEQLQLDAFEGKYYVSIVAFTMQRISPRNLPAIKAISDFHEINVRTYVNNNERPGVYFLNIEAQKPLSAYIARRLSGLPYEPANMQRTDERYSSRNSLKNFHLETTFAVSDHIKHKTGLEKWLTERYCLYLTRGQSVFRYEVHHREWEIREVSIKELQLNYRIGDLHLSAVKDYLAHYSKGVQVLAWAKNLVK